MPLAGYELFRTRDLDEAREQVARVFCPHRLELVKDARLDAVYNSARLNAVGLNYLHYGGDVRITPGRLKTFFLVQIPLRGAAEIAAGRSRLVSTSARASVLSPDDPIDMRWGADNPQLIVRFDRATLQERLSALLGEPAERPLRFALGMELASAPVRSWLRMVAFLREELEHHGGLLDQPLAADPVEELLMTGLLLAQPSNYSDRLHVERPPAAPPAVRRAVELMHARAAEPLTLTDLARATGVGPRSLQSGFRRHLGTTPTAYLRDLRLDRAHADLAAGGASVTEIALRWGFTHQGRFAAAYRRRFGVVPSRTLAG